MEEEEDMAEGEEEEGEEKKGEVVQGEKVIELLNSKFSFLVRWRKQDLQLCRSFRCGCRVLTGS